MTTTALLLTLLALPQGFDRTALEAVVDPYLQEHAIPGAVIAWVAEGEVAGVEAFGLADLESADPMAATTRFQVGSITKPFTATLIADLAEDGALAWDDPLRAHLDVPAHLGGITLRQLATHTSGLPREPSNRRDLPDSPSVMLPMSVEELLEGLADTEISGTPGSFAYSNLGYALLGVVAERATDTSYGEALHARITAPLGMKASGVFLGDDPVPGLATCYWPEDPEPIARDPWSFGTACAFSGLVSTGGDLARFVAAQMREDDGPVLSAATRTELHAPVAKIDTDRGRSIGTGWFVDPMPGGLQAIGHGGEVDGHSAIVFFAPALRKGLVILCNRGDSSAEGLAYPLMGLLLRS